jgi:4-cresol dehydrogenase (hydroxylating)
MFEWRELLGQDAARDDDAAVAPYARTLFRAAPRPAGVLRARDRDQVVQIVRAANRHGVALYPVSRGCNWGFGDACPAGEDQVVLDLSGMDSVHSIDADLAYAVVEPGVSQEALAGRLRADGVPLWMPCTASTPDASVLANAIERGWGHTPYGDHFSHVAGMEVVLGDGSVIDTGLGRFEGSKTTFLAKGGAGPLLEGLFSQSNLGIVTRLGVWLMPEPDCFLGFVLTLGERGHLGELIERLRPLRLSGLLPNPVHVYNDVRAASFLQAIPRDELEEDGALSDGARRALRNRHGLGPWVATGGLYGSRVEVLAGVRALRRAVSGLGTVRMLPPGILAAVERAARVPARLGVAPARRLLEQVARARAPLDYLRGIPNDYALAGCRWRVRALTDPDSLNPLDNHCGLYWVVPTCPARGSDTERLVELVEAVCRRHGLDPLISITLLSGRMLIVPVHIAFDRLDEDESTRAESCHHDLLDECLAAGYPPWRVGNVGFDRLGDSPYSQALARIKRALDPGGVLAPGRSPAPPDRP